MMKWPKRKEAVMKETFSKTSTTHKARNYELKDCYIYFVYKASPNVFSRLNMVGNFLLS